MWTPTHVLITVSKARNLLEKGKGGNDAYCMIGMGKEKFLTSVRPKTLSPTWDEQAEFELTERADIKLTVYHKSSIIDEFVGRVVIDVSELFNENNKAFTKWYKLQAKESKSDSHKKEKERGEIEVRVEFITKAKTGSVMDLASFSKSKEKTLSLKNLKEKSSSIKHSLGDKLKILQKPRKSKFDGENQLAEQARRMDGSKLDFLEGEDIGSLTSSYSSINGPRLANDTKQMSAMSRYNPSRSSFISRTSSRMDVESTSSFNENSANNDEDFNENQDNDDISASFNRNNSFRRSSLRRPSIGKKSNAVSFQSKQEEEFETNFENSDKKIHIAPLPAFLDDHQRHQVQSSVIHEEASPIAPNIRTNSADTSPSNISDNIDVASSFASIFTSSFASGSDKTYFETGKKENEILSTPASILSDIPTPVIDSSKIVKRNDRLKVPGVDMSPQTVKATTLTKPMKREKLSSNFEQDEDEDQIDWASSDDDEIVKQEIESFERNQVINIKELDLLSSSTTKTNADQPVTIKKEINNSSTIINNTDLDKPVNSPKLSRINPFPPSSSFSIDLDPFSSDKELTDPFSNPFYDPFSSFNKMEHTQPNHELDSESTQQTETIKFDSLFTEFKAEDVNDFEQKLDTIEETQENNNNNNNSNDSDSSNSYSVPAPLLKSHRLSTVSANINIEDPFVPSGNNHQTMIVKHETEISTPGQNDDTDNEKDLDMDMDNAFTNFTTNLQLKSESFNELSTLAHELSEANRVLSDLNTETNGIEETPTIETNDEDFEFEEARNVKSQLLSDIEAAPNPFTANRNLRQSERRKLIPTEDLTSDLNSERDFSTSNSNINNSFVSGNGNGNGKKQAETETSWNHNSNRSSMRLNLKDRHSNLEEDIKTPDFDQSYGFQDDSNGKSEPDSSINPKQHNGLPDLIYQKEPTDKAKKYLEGLDGVKFNEIQVPDSLKKQLEYFDRDELLQLIAYQKKYLDYKESRIKDLENYIDNLVVKIIETEPLILMNASCVLAKSKNFA